MKKRTTTTIIIVIAIILTLAYTITSTYSVIINVTEKDGVTEIVNQINIRDLFTNDDGTYNNTYYTVKNELNVTEEEANQLMDSTSLNENFQTILNSIVDYKLHDNQSAKLTNEQIYDLILDGINNTPDLSDEVRNKVIDKSSKYIQDLSDFVYDIEVSLLGES